MTAATILTTAVELREFLEATGPFAVAVWDFDGVIGDTEPAQAEAYRQMLAERGIAPEPGFFDDLAGRPELEIWTLLQDRYHVEGDVMTLRSERIARVIPVLTERVSPNWFVRSAISRLSQLGTRSLIVSSGNQEVIDSYLDAWRLRASFDTVSAASGRTTDVPKRERLREAIAGARSLVIEDSAMYLQFASQLGAATLGVRHTLNRDADVAADAVVSSGPELDA